MDITPVGSFGKWLCKKMKEHDLTEGQLAEIIGVTRASVCYHIRGYKSPHLRVIQAYARYFSVPWEDVYDMILEDKESY